MKISFSRWRRFVTATSAIKQAEFEDVSTYFNILVFMGGRGTCIQKWI